jgi:hypothetical protein
MATRVAGEQMTTLAEYLGNALPETFKQGTPHHFDELDEVQVLHFENGKPLSRGRWAGIYTPVRRVDGSVCDHTETICRQCLGQWQIDHLVRGFAHGKGPSGATVGCRCKLCGDAFVAYQRDRRADDRA